MPTQSCNCTCLGPGFKAAHVPNNNTCFGTLSLNCICLDYSTAHALDHSIMQLHMSRTSYAYMPWTTQSCSCTCLELLMPTCLGPQLHMSRTSCAYMPWTTQALNCTCLDHSNQTHVGKFKEGGMPFNPLAAAITEPYRGGKSAWHRGVR
jgi:hypothetical protein